MTPHQKKCLHRLSCHVNSITPTHLNICYLYLSAFFLQGWTSDSYGSACSTLPWNFHHLHHAIYVMNGLSPRGIHLPPVRSLAPNYILSFSRSMSTCPLPWPTIPPIVSHLGFSDVDSKRDDFLAVLFVWLFTRKKNKKTINKKK